MDTGTWRPPFSPPLSFSFSGPVLGAAGGGEELDASSAIFLTHRTAAPTRESAALSLFAESLQTASVVVRDAASSEASMRARAHIARSAPLLRPQLLKASNTACTATEPCLSLYCAATDCSAFKKSDAFSRVWMRSTSASASHFAIRNLAASSRACATPRVI